LIQKQSETIRLQTERIQQLSSEKTELTSVIANLRTELSDTREHNQLLLSENSSLIMKNGVLLKNEQKLKPAESVRDSAIADKVHGIEATKQNYTSKEKRIRKREYITYAVMTAFLLMESISHIGFWKDIKDFSWRSGPLQPRMAVPGPYAGLFGFQHMADKKWNSYPQKDRLEYFRNNLMLPAQ